MKKVLFLVTGMTPQIITETIWALACEPQVIENGEQWIPDEVNVLSTQDGLDQIKARLFQERIFEQFLADYPTLQAIKFNDNHLHNIANDVQILTDLKTPTDNEVAADLICAKIRDSTLDDEVELHVSIAGGRKTMGFYAGYALSLYGRAQDSMSHVLVEEKFEQARDFFYPTPNDYYVTDRNGKEHNAKNAQVWLAKIPFVRMREAIFPKHQLNNKEDSFSEVVKKINESFKDIRIRLEVTKRTLTINDRLIIKDLPPREFAMLLWFADLRKNGKDGVIAPKSSLENKDISPKESKHILDLSQAYKKYYALLKVKDSFDEDEFESPDMNKSFFDTVKSRLKASLDEKLGLELAARINITQSGKGKPFYLDLSPQAIEIVGQ